MEVWVDCGSMLFVKVLSMCVLINVFQYKSLCAWRTVSWYREIPAD